MRTRIRVSPLLSVLGLAVVLGLSVQSGAQAQQSPATVCANYSQLSGTYHQNGPNGNGPLPVGAVITVTATLGTATSATFEIININAVPVAGPASVPGTLTHTVTSAESTNGIGFDIPSATPADGGTVNIAASCSIPTATAPALSPFGLFVWGLLLLGLGGILARRKLRSSH